MRGNGKDLGQAYIGGTEYGKLWASTIDGSKVEKAMPCFLILPPLFVKLIQDKKKALMPHKVWTLIKTYLALPGLPPECLDACTLALDWCLVATQASGLDKDLHLAFGLDAVTEQDHNESLALWLDTWLNTTLGRRPKQEGQRVIAGPTPPHPSSHALDADIITHAVRQGLALGYQHVLSHCRDPTATTGGGQTGKLGELVFSTDNVCAVMTYSGIKDPQDCQVIWTIFAKKKKTVKVCRRYLMKGMTDYAYDHRISNNAGIYLE
jgi:hypothetical protein